MIGRLPEYTLVVPFIGILTLVEFKLTLQICCFLVFPGVIRTASRKGRLHKTHTLISGQIVRFFAFVSV